LHNLGAALALGSSGSKSVNAIVALRRAIGVCPMTISDEKPRAVSIVEAARMCGLSRATLYRLISQKKLKTLKIGGRRLVPVAAIDILLATAE
jgi:excisionase family DNA binding protein